MAEVVGTASRRRVAPLDRGRPTVAIKATLGREDLRVEPRLLRRGLLDNGYVELPVTSLHAVAIDGLPSLHKDPFDRLLLAQALSEGITLLTGDARLARYPGPVRKV